MNSVSSAFKQRGLCSLNQAIESFTIFLYRLFVSATVLLSLIAAATADGVSALEAIAAMSDRIVGYSIRCRSLLSNYE